MEQQRGRLLKKRAKCTSLAQGRPQAHIHSIEWKPDHHCLNLASGQPSPSCPSARHRELTLVSYYALSAGFELPQYVFDHDTQDFTKTTYELSFKVAMPPCFTQSDFVTGERIEPLVSTLYGDRKIGSSSGPGSISTGPPMRWFNGNGTAGGVCANPAATVTPKCDGSATVQLVQRSGSTFRAPSTSPGR